MLPKLDGLSLIQQLRAKGTRIPVLILSAKASVDDRVEGLQAGGDDYLTKPFAFSELLARIQALIRRSTQATEPTRLVVGDLTLDLLTRDVQRGSEKIELQPREFALLEYLMRSANRTVTKTMILEHIFDYSFDPQTNVVDVLVHRLRSKVDKDPGSSPRGARRSGRSTSRASAAAGPRPTSSSRDESLRPECCPTRQSSPSETSLDLRRLRPMPARHLGTSQPARRRATPIRSSTVPGGLRNPQ